MEYGQLLPESYFETENLEGMRLFFGKISF